MDEEGLREWLARAGVVAEPAVATPLTPAALQRAWLAQACRRPVSVHPVVVVTTALTMLVLMVLTC